MRQDGELGWTQEKHPVDSSRDCIPTIPNLPVRCMPQTDRRLHDVGRTLPGEWYQQEKKEIREIQHGNAHVKSQMLQTLQNDEQLCILRWVWLQFCFFERCFSEQPACQFTPTLWSAILSRVHHLYHVFIIFFVVSISCCCQHLCNPAKEIRLFLNTKVIAQHNKTSNKTSDTSEQANNHNFHAWSIWASLCSGGNSWDRSISADLLQVWSASSDNQNSKKITVAQSFTSRPHTTQGTIFVTRFAVCRYSELCCHDHDQTMAGRQAVYMYIVYCYICSMVYKFIILCGRYRFFLPYRFPWFGHVFSNKGRFGHRRKVPGFFYSLSLIYYPKLCFLTGLSKDTVSGTPHSATCSSTGATSFNVNTHWMPVTIWTTNMPNQYPGGIKTSQAFAWSRFTQTKNGCSTRKMCVMYPCSIHFYPSFKAMACHSSV